MLSVKKKINKNNRAQCFEIFGYDFMLDEKCDPYLIEVNTNPCI
jgi:D-alanine-D-alanine ligase-like ATP-grasp enzyme